MKEKNLHVRIDRELYNEFINITNAKLVNRSGLIRYWIEEYLGYEPGERQGKCNE